MLGVYTAGHCHMWGCSAGVLTLVSGGQARRRTAQKKPLQATRGQFPGMSCKSRGTCHEHMRRRALKIFLQ